MRNIFQLLVALVAASLLCVGCNKAGQSEKMVRAVAVWSEGRETEQNLTLAFREVVEVEDVESAYVRLAASCDYRMRVNGEFVAHGPCVAAHNYYRIDCYDIAPYLREGENLIAIEVAGYNLHSFYLLDQPSFLQAEVELNGKIVAATGEDFEAYDLGQRIAKTDRFSKQRTFREAYSLEAGFDDWAKQVDWKSNIEAEKLVAQSEKTLIPRGVAYPDYTKHDAALVAENLFKFKTNSTGFLCAKVKVTEPTKLTLRFDEILGENGRVMARRQSYNPYMTYELGVGEYELEAFEPYTMQYVEPIVESGACEVEHISLRNYCNSDCERATFHSSSEELNFLFEAARNNYRQNALDIFMDCPGRERAGWLCDSYFTARSEFALSGVSRIEYNFIENYLLPERFRDVPQGMIPMCYPADHRSHTYIPNWSMWFVLQLEEYLERTGDTKTIERARERVMGLVNFFADFENKDGLLERLQKWVFVDYSKSNDFVQHISYPTNMLYAEMLDVVSRLYGEKHLAAKAERIREVIRRQSFNGEFFVDNAMWDAISNAAPTNNITESCQYYAFIFGVATPESHPELWRVMRDEFHPVARRNGSHPNVHPANAFIGGYLRFEMLSREGLSKQILDESIETYLSMAKKTGTLWEYFRPKASCNHGFASHLTCTLYRDVLGVYKVLPREKKVQLRFIESGLEHCEASMPVGDEKIDISWRYSDGEFKVKLSLPKGYSYELIPTESKVTIE